MECDLSTTAIVSLLHRRLEDCLSEPFEYEIKLRHNEIIITIDNEYRGLTKSLGAMEVFYAEFDIVDEVIKSSVQELKEHQ